MITTDVAGCSELVRDGENGYLIKPGSIEAIEAAIEKLVASFDGLTSMGRRARDNVEQRFSNRQVIDEHIRIYDRMVGIGS